MPFSDYSNTASATTSAGGGGTPVAGAYMRLQSTDGVLNTSFGPAADGDAIGQWTEQEVFITGWFGQSGLEPIYQSDGGSLVNGKPYVEMLASKTFMVGLTSDFDPGSLTFYALLNPDVGVTGNGTLLDLSGATGSGGDGSLKLYLGRNGNVGYSTDGTDVEIAAEVTGWQVLTWVIDYDNTLVSVYRNQTLLGTSAVVSGDAYDFGAGSAKIFADGAGANKCPGKYLDLWGYKTAHGSSDRMQQIAYLMSRAGI